MGKRSTAAVKLPNTGSSVERLFHRFTVAPGECPTEYEGLVQAVISDLQPNDTIETILAKDVADHSWEVQRMRWIETALLDGEAEPLEHEHRSPEVTAIIEETIARLRAPQEVTDQRPRNAQERERLEREFAAQYPEKYAAHLRRQEESIEEGKKKYPWLYAPKHTPVKPTVSPAVAKHSAAEAFKKNIREIDLISRLIALAESRRNAALRELERYRATRLARERHDILDAEYTEFSAGRPNGRS